MTKCISFEYAHRIMIAEPDKNRKTKPLDSVFPLIH